MTEKNTGSENINTLVTVFFPVCAIALSILGYFFPSIFTPMKSTIIPFLIVIMLGMGMTLTIDDFKRVMKIPKVIAAGVLLQYSIMPLAAFLIGHVLQMPTEILVGLVLVGCCPGGTASNVMCYLAKADVALSISLTMLSTLLAIFMTPLLTELYVGQQVPVPALDMLMSILKIVVVPVAMGVMINTFAGTFFSRLVHIFPIISMIAIVVIIAVIVALTREKIATMGMVVVSSVILHNIIGLAGGYGGAKLLGFDNKTCRTLAFETGMQNSGLGVALASQYFSALAALPGALFSIWHNLSGSVLAAVWSRRQDHTRN